MNPATTDVLNRNLFLVKEHTGLFKAANNFDIHDPESGEIILECREESLGMITRMLRFTDYKRMTPFNIEIREPGGPTLIRVTRGISFFLSKVQVYDRNDELVGGLPFLSVTVLSAFSGAARFPNRSRPPRP